jgi:hypothetical protein
MFETRHQPLLPRPQFLLRLFWCGILAAGLMAGSLAIGILGYHALAGLSWIDSLLNASMILGGMGPVDTLHDAGAKLFASAYALYSGMVLIATIGIALGPIVHRLLHRFHVDDQDLEPTPSNTGSNSPRRPHADHQ